MALAGHIRAGQAPKFGLDERQQLLMYDYSSVPAATLREAESTVAQIYRDAGVDSRMRRSSQRQGVFQDQSDGERAQPLRHPGAHSATSGLEVECGFGHGHDVLGIGGFRRLSADFFRGRLADR